GTPKSPAITGGNRDMKQLFILTVVVLVAAATAPAGAHQSRDTLVVTTSNNVAGNALIAYDATGTLVQTIPTGGLGGVSGNAGGVAAEARTVAVVNFQSQSVSLFQLTHEGFVLTNVIGTISPPL